MLIGMHARTGGSIASAVGYAAGLGSECVQVFAKSPQRWLSHPLDPVAAAQARELASRLGMPLFTHTAYLINLGTTDPELRRRSVDALADELVRGAALGALGVVTHIGTDVLADPDTAADRIVEAVAEACVQAGEAGGRLLLLENSAGAGSSFGGSFEELGAVFERLDDLGLGAGLCLDTCHAHAYGHDLTGGGAWAAVLDSLEGCCGRGRLRLLHANDCAYPLGSKKDRHAWIGDGAIGYGGFEAMLREPRVSEVPAVMEMSGEAPAKDVENLSRLKRARDAAV
ncbi:MAG TPA: deoxyribonuclease IV [Coriobacteriia bacterium]|jgi:deoxyribonuclease-4